MKTPESIKTAEDYLIEINKHIASAISRKQQSVTIREAPFCYWLYGKEDELRTEQKLALKTLRDGGFRVSLYYREYQFVDIGLEIKW